MLDIYELGEDVLREDTEEVKVFDSSLALLVDAMFDTLAEADGVGLAGPQVGVSKKIFIVDLHEGEKGKYCFINPQITETSEELSHYEEGCLSIPGFYEDVFRPARIKIEAQDVNGKRFQIDADGLLARVCQHENDHLNKILFIDHLDEKTRNKIVKTCEKRAKKRKKGK